MDAAPMRILKRGNAALNWTHAPEKLTLRCPRCRFPKDGLQTYHLVEADMRRPLHRYECERCGLDVELTQENAHEFVKLYRKPSLWQRILGRGAA